VRQCAYSLVGKLCGLSIAPTVWCVKLFPAAVGPLESPTGSLQLELLQQTRQAEVGCAWLREAIANENPGRVNHHPSPHCKPPYHFCYVYRFISPGHCSQMCSTCCRVQRVLAIKELPFQPPAVDLIRAGEFLRIRRLDRRYGLQRPIPWDILVRCFCVSPYHIGRQRSLGPPHPIVGLSTVWDNGGIPAPSDPDHGA
jgi:hypothetical protein